MTPTLPGIVESDYSTADDFLAALSPLASASWGSSPTRWAFRGQADATWRLLPKALRDDVPLDYFPAGKSGLCANNEDQVRAEFDLLMDFFWAADAQGLHIPEDGQ